MKKSWLSIAVLLLYLSMHIYFAYYAFTTFKLWFALVTFLAPVLGDMLLCGASIGLGNWLPTILLVVVFSLYGLSTVMAEKTDSNE